MTDQLLELESLQPQELSGFYYPSPAEKRLRILLIEDNVEHARWIQDMLGDDPREAIELAWVPTMTDAVGVLNQMKPDLILLDLGLPDLSGYKCQLVMGLVAPGTPVIVLTGDDSIATRELVALAGSAKYLVKSEVTPEVLGQAIRESLASEQK